MKRKICILFILFLYTNANAQKSKEDYLSVISKFYFFLCSDVPVYLSNCNELFDKEFVGENEEAEFYKNCKIKHINGDECKKSFEKYYHDTCNPISLYFLKIKECKTEISMGLSINKIRKNLLDSSKLIDDGRQSDIYICLYLNGNKIYFAMNKYIDEECKIDCIYLSDGSSLNNKIDSKYYKTFLQIIGTIDDKDGFCNLREKPNAHSPIVGKIKMGELVYYTPNSNSLWWKVQKPDSPKMRGYVYFDRIRIPMTQQ